MTQFTLREKAESDLLSIGRYTQKKWGFDQRNRYLSQIDAAFPILAKNPDRGRKCDHIIQGYFKYTVEKHDIYFRKIKTGIEIVRILHQRMDVKKHL